METTDNSASLPENTEALQARVQELEAEIERRDKAAEAAQSRREKATLLAGEVALSAVAGSDVKRHARDFWDAWRSYGNSQRTGGLPEEETRDLAVSVLARLTRVKVLYFLIAFISSIFLILQSMFLYQQNMRFDVQNNLMAFNQTSNIRNLLFVPPFDSVGNPVADYRGLPDSLIYGISSLYEWPSPNQAILEQIIQFSRDEPGIVIPALKTLVRDSAPPVAIGALRILSNRFQPVDSIYAQRGHFYGALLRGSDLRNSDLSGSNMSKSDMFRVDARGSILLGVDLSGSKLILADLRGAKMGLADLSRAYLSGADLSGADLSGAVLSNTNLFCLRGAPDGFLETVIGEGGVANDSLRADLQTLEIECSD